MSTDPNDSSFRRFAIARCTGTEAPLCAKARKGISTDRCNKIWEVLGKAIPKKGLDHYERAKKPHFGMAIEYCVLFDGRPTLPYDHPNHDEELQKVAESLVPSIDILVASFCDNYTLAIDLRNCVGETIDVDRRKLLRFDLKGIIKKAKQEGIKELQHEVNFELTTINATTTDGAIGSDSNQNNNRDIIAAVVVAQKAKQLLREAVNQTNEKVNTLENQMREAVNQTNEKVSTLENQMREVAAAFNALSDKVEGMKSWRDYTDNGLSAIFGTIDTAIDGLQASQQQQQAELADMKRTIEDLSSR